MSSARSVLGYMGLSMLVGAGIVFVFGWYILGRPKVQHTEHVIEYRSDVEPLSVQIEIPNRKAVEFKYNNQPEFINGFQHWRVRGDTTITLPDKTRVQVVDGSVEVNDSKDNSTHISIRPIPRYPVSLNK